MSAYLNDEFIRKCAQSNKIVIILLLVKNLSLLSRWSDEARIEWKEMRLVEACLNATKAVEEHLSTRDLNDKDNSFKNAEENKALKEIILNAYYAIGNVADDKEIELIAKRSPLVIESMLGELDTVEKLFSKDKLLEKERTPFMNEDKSVGYLKASYLSRITTPNLIGLARFAVSSNT
jgi:hypothetical protein